MTTEPRRHSIGGYEWECGECHYHMARWENQKRIPETCRDCGQAIVEENDGQYVDSTGAVVDHDTLYSAEALADERRATVERIRVEFFGSDGTYNPQHFADGDLPVIRRILDEEAARG